ncbi:MAG: 4Fe-4S dicluster domain-containing protein [Actinobacteria bacterium]|nr:MAG: 4Fe-4S dicluster domain-containing protein [Actinomycetota bacterium]
MCRFCAQHGDGKRWYLEASNYATELLDEADRRGYMVRFLRDFDRNRRRVLTACELAEKVPAPLAKAGKERFARHMREHHFGQPVPLEQCEAIFDTATCIVNLPCPCRTFAGKSEEGFCLAITVAPVEDLLREGMAGYGDGPDTLAFTRLDKAEAMALLRRAEERGLMHSVWTFETPFIGAICNCDLASGCMAMTLTVGHGAKLMWRGEDVAVLDTTACTGCGACVRRCPFAAIDRPASKGAPAVLRQADCWGCGVCRSACASEALSLVERAAVPAVAGVW